MRGSGATGLRTFAAATAVALAAVVLVVSLILHGEAVEDIESLGRHEHEHLTLSLASALAPTLVPLLSGDGAVAAPPDLRAVDDLVAPVVSSSNVAKLKVYDLRGLVVYSTDPTEIGDDQGANEAVLRAFGGESTIALEREHTFNESDGEALERSVLEGYVPLYAPGSDSLVGVFEAYGDVTALLTVVNRAERVVIVTVTGAVAGAWILIIALYRRTDRALAVAEERNHQNLIDLREAHDGLERRVCERTRDLEESERRFRDIATAAGEYLWETDRAGRYTYLSDRVGDVLGFGPAELLGRRPVEFMPADDAEDVRLAARAGCSSEAFRDLQHRSHTRDGATVWQSVSGVPVFDESGVVVGHRGTASDITERRQAVEQIRKLSEAVEQSPNAIIISDAQGTIEYVNLGFCEASGYRRHEAVGRPISILKSGRTSSETYAELWATIRGGATWRGEICNRRKDSTLYWDLLSVSPIKAPDGATTHYVAVQTDITTRMAQEESLRESEGRLRAVMNGVADAIVTIDAAGTVEQCNPAVERLFGWRTAELVGQRVEMLMPEPDRTNHVQFIDRFLNAEPPRETMMLRREVEGLRKDGVTFPLELSVGEMRENGARKFVGVMRDLTERRRTERELAAARQKYFHREKVAAIGQLAAGILHEVGNPVSAIGGALLQLRGQIEEGSAPRDMVATVALIQGQVATLEAISHDVARVSSPHEVDWALVDVNQLCRDATSLLRYDQRTADIDVGLELDPMIPAVHASADQLMQVLLNALLNATHACYQHGIDRSYVEVSTRVGPGHVELTVSDNGVGMDEETRLRACDAFFTTKPPAEGTGLGLSLCKSLVEEHGGSLQIESAPGQGTRLTVCLPVREGELEEAPGA